MAASKGDTLYIVFTNIGIWEGQVYQTMGEAVEAAPVGAIVYAVTMNQRYVMEHLGKGLIKKEEF